MPKIKFTDDLAMRIRWGLTTMRDDGILKDVGQIQNRDTESEIRVIADDGKPYSITVVSMMDDKS